MCLQHSVAVSGGEPPTVCLKFILHNYLLHLLCDWRHCYWAQDTYVHP